MKNISINRLKRKSSLQLKRMLKLLNKREKHFHLAAKMLRLKERSIVIRERERNIETKRKESQERNLSSKERKFNPILLQILMP